MVRAVIQFDSRNAVYSPAIFVERIAKHEVGGTFCSLIVEVVVVDIKAGVRHLDNLT